MDMEEQLITIKVRTAGDKCQLTDEQIRLWYAEAIRNALNPAYGTPEITVDVQRNDLGQR